MQKEPARDSAEFDSLAAARKEQARLAREVNKGKMYFKEDDSEYSVRFPKK